MQRMFINLGAVILVSIISLIVGWKTALYVHDREQFAYAKKYPDINSIKGLYNQIYSKDVGIKMAAFGYLTGAAKFINLSQADYGSKNNHPPFDGTCIPDNTSLEQLASAYVEWVESNPDWNDKPKDVGIMISYIESFPCS